MRRWGRETHCREFLRKRNGRKAEVLRNPDRQRRKRETAKDEGKWEARNTQAERQIAIYSV